MEGQENWDIAGSRMPPLDFSDPPIRGWDDPLLLEPNLAAKSDQPHGVAGYKQRGTQPKPDAVARTNPLNRKLRRSDRP